MSKLAQMLEGHGAGDILDISTFARVGQIASQEANGEPMLRGAAKDASQQGKKAAAFILNAVAGLYDKRRVVPTPKAKKHGNTLNDTPAECYSLRCRITGKVKKYGETIHGEDKYGSGKQRRYSRKYLKDNKLDYYKEHSGTKKSEHKLQTDKIKKFESENGSKPDDNKTYY